MKRKRYKRKTKASGNFNKKLFLFTLVLTVIGLAALADASAPFALSEFSNKYYFIKRQFIAAVMGLIFMFSFSFIHYKYWEKVATLLFAGSVFLLFLVLLPGFGLESLGAQRWLILGPLTLQPSEIVKLSLAIYLAKVASNDMKPQAYFVPIVILGVLIMLQPDLGTTMVIVAIGMAQIVMSGIPLFYVAASLVVGGLASMFLILTSDYRRDRLLTFFQQTNDPLGKGYHIRQILFALGAGGITGVGLGHSRQKHLFLPESATDSIFAVIAEETGFVGGTVLILLFLAFFIYGLRIAKNAPDKFSQILAIGIITWITSQAFFNIASNVVLTPLTGIPLPLFSYGGSALVSTLMGVGILLNISRYSKS